MQEYKNYVAKKKSRQYRAGANIKILLFLCSAVGVTTAAIVLFVTIFPVNAATTLQNAGSAGNMPQQNSGALPQASSATYNAGAWQTILVNKWNYLPDNYEVELAEIENGERVDARIYNSLAAMLQAARSDGLGLLVVSGYRTAEQQQQIMDDKIAAYIYEGYNKEEATELAQAAVAAVGTSEHQLGLAVDINADKVVSTREEVYEWLAKNGHRFGFIYRYPANKTDITGIINEPWHYRYVGPEVANEMYENGICLEEWVNDKP